MCLGYWAREASMKRESTGKLSFDSRFSPGGMCDCRLSDAVAIGLAHERCGRYVLSARFDT